MTSNHAHQKLFPSIITCPYLLLLLPIPIHHMQETPLILCDQHVIKLQPWTNDWHVVKLRFPEPWTNDLHIVKLHCPILRPFVQYVIKLHILDPSQLDYLLLETPSSLVPHRIHRRHWQYAAQGHVPCLPCRCTHMTDHVEGLMSQWHVPLLAMPMTP
jgi:hypothetical protein